jgi:predicted RNA-binding protein with PIN domain
MRWLVDGYNVIRCTPELAAHEQESLQAGREALCRLLASAARTSGDQFTVVFDGTRGGGTAFRSGAVRMLFSKAPERADHMLARLASAGTAVVSNDLEVRRNATRSGAVVVTADEFVARLLAPSVPEKDEDEDEPRPRPKKGNPRRPPKKARAAGRALRRLDPNRKR